MSNALTSKTAAWPIGIRLAAALLGALVVAAAAQVSVPIPGSPVPFTLQPLAVLVVGGLLGARVGALSLVLYLALGAAGLPVFTPFGAPGVARLMGPTGGFLIAYPVAAAVVGRLVGPSAGPSFRRSLAASFAGMATIFAGGLAQLAVLHYPLAIGLVPFVGADLAKVLLAGLIIGRLRPLTRALN